MIHVELTQTVGPTYTAVISGKVGRTPIQGRMRSFFSDIDPLDVYIINDLLTVNKVASGALTYDQRFKVASAITEKLGSL